MKRFAFLSGAGLCLSLNITSFAQQSANQSIEISNPCQDKYLHGEMVDLNKDFAQQGFSLELFKVLSFPAKTYIPVTVNLEEGEMYQINFVANRDFQKASLVLLDEHKKELINKKYNGKSSQQHWFSQSVVAPYTGTYWIILTQKVKGEDQVCGGLSVLKAGQSGDDDQ